MPDNLRIFGLDYSNIDGIKAIDTNGNEITYTRYPIEIPGPVDDSPVKFIDYDGAILYSYSAEDFLALSAMPANPSHTGLAAQGWNYTLADAQSYVNAYGALTIGQMYTTASGATEIDIELKGAALSPYLQLAPNGTVVIDWGDNSTSTVTGTSLTTMKRTQHVYASAGSYTIKATVSSGTCALYGSANTTLLSANQTSSGNLPQNRVYANCVKAVRIGQGVTVGNYAFQCCSSLTSVTIPSSVTSIGDDTFATCPSLTSVTIPSSVTSMGTEIFYTCSSLTSVTIPSSVTSIENDTFRICSSLTSVTIPSSVTSIGLNAFHTCSSLTSVTIPSSVTRIEDNTFSSCSSLTSVTIPSSVTSIGGNAFSSCYSLTSVTIPSSVTSIGSSAFTNCFGLLEIALYGTDVPTLGSSALSGAQFSVGARIYVPASALTDYQTATNWSAYASYMVGV